MTLVQAWVDSVSLLKPKHLKLFTLVTLKSILDAYKVLAKYWWWLFAIIIGCFVVPYVWTDSIYVYVQAERISQWAYQILLFAALVATRPSLFPKDCAYFRSNMPYFLIQAVFIVFASYIYWPTAVAPAYFFGVLFFLDSGKNIFFYDNKVYMTNNDLLMSWWRAFLMVIYNYPLLVVINLFFYAPVYGVYSYVFFAPLLHNVIGAFLLPITVCTYTNIYIKKLHDQFDLYFKQPK